MWCAPSLWTAGVRGWDCGSLGWEEVVLGLEERDGTEWDLTEEEPEAVRRVEVRGEAATEKMSAVCAGIEEKG